jgi:hypothetical protein
LNWGSKSQPKDLHELAVPSATHTVPDVLLLKQPAETTVFAPIGVENEVPSLTKIRVLLPMRHPMPMQDVLIQESGKTRGMGLNVLLQDCIGVQPFWGHTLKQPLRIMEVCPDSGDVTTEITHRVILQ